LSCIYVSDFSNIIFIFPTWPEHYSIILILIIQQGSNTSKQKGSGGVKQPDYKSHKIKWQTKVTHHVYYHYSVGGEKTYTTHDDSIDDEEDNDTKRYKLSTAISMRSLDSGGVIDLIVH